MKRAVGPLVICVIAAWSSIAVAQARSFGGANEAYKDGRYGDAIRGYESVVAGGIYHESLFYNLGNAYFRNGQLGPAIYNYERALRIDPRFEDAAFNLDLARAAVAERVVDRLEGAEQASVWIRAVTYFSTAQHIVGFLIVNAVFFLALIAIRFLSTGVPRTLLIVTNAFVGVALAVCLVLVIGHIYYLQRIDLGIVVSDRAFLREGADESLAERAEVHPGLRVRILDHDTGWLQVRLSNGVEGWIPQHAIGEL